MKQTEIVQPEKSDNEGNVTGASSKGSSGKGGSGAEASKEEDSGSEASMDDDSGSEASGDDDSGSEASGEFVEKSKEQAVAEREERQQAADQQADSVREAEVAGQEAYARDGEEPVIVINGLRKAFHGVEVLRGVDLHVNKGENLVILGKSGTGKSVLIKCLIGLEWPDEGEIKIFGKEVLSLNYAELNQVRLRTGVPFPECGALRLDDREGKPGISRSGS